MSSSCGERTEGLSRSGTGPMMIRHLVRIVGLARKGYVIAGKWACLAVSTLLVGQAALAADARDLAWPERPVHLLVPYSPGGPNDILARLLGERLAHSLGQPLVIENRAGASGNIAMEMAAKAKPDGYTLVMPAMAYVVNPVLLGKVPYRIQDFAAVSLVARGPLALVVPAAASEHSVAELIEHIRARPGHYQYGSGGSGSSPHLAAALFCHEAKLDMVHVAYKGTNDVLPDLFNGTLHLAFLSPLVVDAQVKAGRLRVLATTSSQRLSAMPAVPALGEVVARYHMESWYALLAPAATPLGVRDRLARETAQALADPEVLVRLASLGVQADGEGGAAAAEFMRTEASRWEIVLKSADIGVQ